MSKLSNKSNTIKNGHLTKKLQSIGNSKFPKNRFHTLSICLTSTVIQYWALGVEDMRLKINKIKKSLSRPQVHVYTKSTLKKH